MSNFCTFIGRLGADPEARYIETRGGSSVTLVSFSLASDQYPEDQPLWIDVAVWDERLQKFCGHLKKGSSVAITGKLSAKPFTTRGGDLRPGLQLKADRIEFAGSNKKDDGQSHGNGAHAGDYGDAF